VRIGTTTPHLWLELRAFGDTGDWRRACPAPCGRFVLTDGFDARLTAPGMTPSAPFRIVPGGGTAQIAVDPGSSTARSWGRISFAAGLPLALLGALAFAYGSYNDQATLRGIGALGLGGGGALVVVSLPLLVLGSTEVHNAQGEWIALGRAPRAW